MKLNQQAFTLIELLVVVLIISILAAIALPQYKQAVVKSKIMSYVPLVKSIVTAQEAYYLANGQYATDLRKLDVQMPADCSQPTLTAGNSWSGNVYKCGTDFYLDNSLMNSDSLARGVFMLEYCSQNNTSYDTCSKKREIIIHFNFQHGPSRYFGNPGDLICEVKSNSALGKKVCKSLTGTMNKIIL